MRKLINPTLMCLAVLLLFSSCVSKKKFTELMTDKESIDKMLADQQQKVASLESDLSNLKDEKTQLEENFNSETTRLNSELNQVQTDLKSSQAEIAQVKQDAEAKGQKLEQVQKGLDAAFDVYTKSGLSLSSRNNALYVNTSAPVRYNSGSTRISTEARTMLEELANTLKGNPAMRILVEGHTDSVPLKEGAAYSDNLALSAARANRVVRTLVKLGVSPDQLASVGRGESMPSMTEDGENSDEAKSMNRRTEFVVLASVGELYEFAKDPK